MAVKETIKAKEHTPSPTRRSVRYYAVLAASFFVFLATLVVMSQLSISPQKKIKGDEKTPETVLKQVDSLEKQIEHVTQLALALFGAVAIFIPIESHKRPVSMRQLHLASFAWLFAGVSMFYGFLANRRVLWMLGAGFVDLQSLVLQFPVILQVGAFVLSLLVFARLAYITLQGRG